MTKDKALTGTAGAYYVAYRLAAEGYAIGLTAYGTRAIDLAVANPDTGKSITIQTKTGWNAFVRSRKYPPYWKWRVRKFTEHKTLFYAFVDLKGNLEKIPDVFIVPSMELRPLLSSFPEGTDLESPEAMDVWCNGINEENAPNYKNRWGIIKAALA